MCCYSSSEVSAVLCSFSEVSAAMCSFSEVSAAMCSSSTVSAATCTFLHTPQYLSINNLWSAVLLKLLRYNSLCCLKSCWAERGVGSLSCEYVCYVHITDWLIPPLSPPYSPCYSARGKTDQNIKRKTSLILQYLQIQYVQYNFFGSLSTLIFLYTGCRLRTQDLCLRSLVRYKILNSHHISAQ